MALNFGKLNFSTSFNPTSAFPLDARCYFENLASAQAAAATAEAAGSSNTVYYFGETLAVLENNVATLYIIQPKDETGVGGELVEVGSKTLGDEKSIKLVDGTLSLVGFETAAENQVPYRKADGSLGWQVVSALVPEATATVGDDATVNVSLIDNKYVVTLRGKDSAADKAILRKHVNDDVVTYTWDVIYDKTELDALLANKVDKENGKSLVLDTEITKLGTVAEGANKVESSVQNGYIKIDGVETKVYEEAADVVHDVNYKHITVTSGSVSDGENIFEKYDDAALTARVNSVENLANTKQDILGFEGEYNKESNKVATASYVLAEIGKIKHWSYEVVESLPEVTAGEEHKIYLVAKGEGKVGYKEYIFLPGIEGVREARFEEIGDTDIDLSNCATKGELAALEERIKVFENNKSIYDEAVNKLSNIAEGAQVNVIEKIQVNGVDVNPVEKVVNIAVPTGALASKNNVAEADLEEVLANKINNKQDKLTAGNGLVIENNEIKLDEIIFDCGSASDWAPKSE